MSERRWAAWTVTIASIAFIGWGSYTRNIAMMIIGFLLNFVDAVAFAVHDVYKARIHRDEEESEE